MTIRIGPGFGWSLLLLCPFVAACSLRAGTFELPQRHIANRSAYPWRVAVIVDKEFMPYKITFKYWSSTPFTWSLEGLPDALVKSLSPYFLSVEPLQVGRGTSTERHDLVARMSVDQLHFDGANTTEGRDRVDLTMTFTVEQPNGRAVFRTTVSASASRPYTQRIKPDPREAFTEAFSAVFAQLSERLGVSDIQLVQDGISETEAPSAPAVDDRRPPNTTFGELRTKAEAGDAEAQSDLGWAYYNGDGVVEDSVEAVNWFRRSAEQGNASGQNRLGVAYHDGKGVSKDVAQALAWYRKAADQGLVLAQLNLAWSYNNGLGVPRDYAEAAVWYRKAAEQGHAGAQSDLGVAYANGEGVKQDKREAERWFKKASEQGYAVATFRLARMYWNEELGGGGGIGRLAIDNFEKAAEQGYPLSAFTLSEIYTRRTRYNARDDHRACMWSVVVEALLEKGNVWEKRQPAATAQVRRELPKLLVRVRRPLTQQQLQECDGQAREWLAAHTP